MLKIKAIGLTFFLLVVSACVDPKPKKIPVKPKEPVEMVSKPVGIGISKLNKVQRFKEHPLGYYYYGQLLVEPELSMSAVKGIESKELLAHVAELFHDHRQNFGLSVTPIINGITLPDMILFTYAYDSATQRWKTTLNENPRTGMVLLTPSTELKFKFKYISINERDFSKITDITSLFNGGAWILSKASKPMIDMIGGRVGDILSNSVSTTVTNSFVPVTDGVKSVSYSVQTRDGKRLATVKFSLLLSSSVVSGNGVEEGINRVPKADKFMNPLNAIKTDISSNFTLYDELNRVVALNRFSQIENPKSFRNMCRTVLNQLESYGLNQFDRLNAFSQILDTTDFTRNPQLYTSGCLLNHEFQRLKEMGIPLNAVERPTYNNVVIDSKVLDMVAGYMKSPLANRGHRNQLLSILSPNIISLLAQNTDLDGFHDLTSEEYPTATTALNILERFKEVGVARACCYRFPSNYHSSFLFRALNGESIYRLTLSRQVMNGRINSIKIEPWAEDRISPYNLKRLKTVAKNSVEHSEKDFLIN
jgi:hypothetical protein